MHRSALVQSTNSKSGICSGPNPDSELDDPATHPACDCPKEPLSITPKQSITPKKSLSPENRPDKMPHEKQQKRKQWIRETFNSVLPGCCPYWGAVQLI